MIPFRLTFLCLGALLLPQGGGAGGGAGGEDAFRAAVAAYEAGRHAEALAGFRALAAAAGELASPELLGDLALAALRAQRPGDAEPAVQRLLAADDAGERARGAFLSGLCHWQRCDVAEAAAKLQDAEPFAYDVAVKSCRQALAAFLAADAPGAPWPAARRNAERAAVRLAALEKAKDEADAARRSKQEKAPPPPVPDERKEQEPAPPQPAASQADVADVLERLRQKERQKRVVRAAAQGAAATAGERGW